MHYSVVYADPRLCWIQWAVGDHGAPAGPDEFTMLSSLAPCALRLASSSFFFDGGHFTHSWSNFSNIKWNGKNFSPVRRKKPRNGSHVWSLGPPPKVLALGHLHVFEPARICRSSTLLLKGPRSVSPCCCVAEWP
ncbi:hypothetical protein Mapa_015391 [Marchantia paleacea]|nr:hypothetical protein Mapa_015391 [Marchantia paleacea]